MEKKKVVILGAGIAGLSMGYCLSRAGKYQVTVIEQAPVVGGLCGSFKHGGFMLDHGAHKLYSVIPGVLDELKDLMGERLLKLPKSNRIFLNGKLLDYPMRLGNLLTVMGPGLFLQLGFGYAWTVVKGIFKKEPPKSYEEYMIKAFGRPAYKLVFEPLADKVWGNPSQLHPEMARTRIPAKGGFDILLKLLGLKKETAETNAEYFYYPRKGFGDFPQKLKEEIERLGGDILTNTEVKSVRKEGQRIVGITAGVNGIEKEFSCDSLISTIPLTVLSRYVLGEEGRSHKVDKLQFRHLVLVYVFVNKPFVLKDQWIFFPEKKFVFSRIFEQKHMNKELCPENETAVCCDFTCEEEDWKWKADDQRLADECVKGLEEAGFIEQGEVSGFLVKRQRNFYPRYDLNYVETMKEGSAQLKAVDNLLLTGRLGMYNYNNSDHCYDMARFISDHLESGKSHGEVWTALEEHVKDYQIVD